MLKFNFYFHFDYPAGVDKVEKYFHISYEVQDSLEWPLWTSPPMRDKKCRSSTNQSKVALHTALGPESPRPGNLKVWGDRVPPSVVSHLIIQLAWRRLTWCWQSLHVYNKSCHGTVAMLLTCPVCVSRYRSPGVPPRHAQLRPAGHNYQIRVRLRRSWSVLRYEKHHKGIPLSLSLFSLQARLRPTGPPSSLEGTKARHSIRNCLVPDCCHSNFNSYVQTQSSAVLMDKSCQLSAK